MTLAIMRSLLESWLRFQKDVHAEARRILQEIQPVLESTSATPISIR